jgi:hypothetical protein
VNDRSFKSHVAFFVAWIVLDAVLYWLKSTDYIYIYILRFAGQGWLPLPVPPLFRTLISVSDDFIQLIAHHVGGVTFAVTAHLFTNHWNYNLGWAPVVCTGRVVLAGREHRLSTQDRDELHTGNFLVLDSYCLHRTKQFSSLLIEIQIPSALHTADCLHGTRDRDWWQKERGIIIGKTVVVLRKEVCRPCCTQLWYSHCCNNKRWNPIESFFLIVVGAKETSNNPPQSGATPFIWGWQSLDSNSGCPATIQSSFLPNYSLIKCQNTHNYFRTWLTSFILCSNF